MPATLRGCYGQVLSAQPPLAGILDEAILSHSIWLRKTDKASELSTSHTMFMEQVMLRKMEIRPRQAKGLVKAVLSN